MMRLTLLLLLAACNGEKPPADTDPAGGDDSGPVGCDTIWYADADGDGHGDAAVGFVACEPPGREVQNSDDCDDTNAAAYPGAPEDCTTTFDANCDGAVSFEDGDRDGSAACEDCDDANPGIKPGAAEFCDGIDTDCDGAVDEDAVDGTLWYQDADGDGRGSRATETRACEAPEGYGRDFADCDDTNAEVNPEATETCNGVDDDCTGSVDDNAVDALTWWTDSDADGYGFDPSVETGCTQPVGTVLVGGDCEDLEPTINPGMPEVCNDIDDDCSGTVDGADATDRATWYLDRDADGWGDAAWSTLNCDQPVGYAATSGDCDDTDVGASPSRSETCDGTDDDCDGTVDEDDATDAGTWYVDADTDGYGDPTRSSRSCSAPAGSVAFGTDCDDTVPSISPGTAETCNTIDDDCDGVTDEDSAIDAIDWYLDTDGDGFGSTTAYAACAMPAGYAATDDDCDDGAAAISPGGIERCNGIDDNCDGETDEDAAVDAPDWYRDADADGFGSTTTWAACAQPSGYVTTSDDCDDGDDAFHPGAAESDCGDPADYNCDGSVGADDADGDGWSACEECDDRDLAINPSAPEACNLVDDDCDGIVDGPGAVGSGQWYADTDGDGFGDAGVIDYSCDLPAGFVADATDCDDGTADISPAATELCATEWDDDCDGDTSELRTPDCTRYYLDFDEDGFGSTSSVCACEATDVFTASTDDDCDDGNADAYPGGVEVRNGVDDDCDGLVDTSTTDNADAVVSGDTTDDAVGAAFSAGDVDGDGSPDLVIGIQTDDANGANAGAVAVMSGPFAGGTTDVSAATATLLGTAVGDAAGTAVAVGDLDGDGYADVLVGATDSDAGARNGGAAFLLYGPLSGTVDLGSSDLELTGVVADDAAGTTVAFPGDVDGDGVGDLLVGAPASDAGARSGGSVYLTLGGGSGSTSLGTAEAELYGPTASDAAGDAITSAGDTNGDGFADFLVGVGNDDDNGSASGTTYVLEGPVTGVSSLGGAAAATLVGEAASDNAGASVAGVGDVDGDGYDDVFVGAHGAGVGGQAYLMLSPFAGRMYLSGADATFTGPTGSLAGYAVAGVGDTDGDEVPDLLVGGYANSSGGTNAGAAWLYTGGVPAGTIDLADTSLFIGSAGDRAGVAVGGLGDTDGDGLMDFLIGAFGADVTAEDSGAVYVFRGL